MAISPAGCFDYTVVVTRDRPIWRGSCETLSTPSFHPGLAGSRPQFELAAGIVTFRSTESRQSLNTNPHFDRWGPPASLLRMPVGLALESVLAEGDILRVSRHSTTDLAISVRTGADLRIGLGAVGFGHLSPKITIEEDPRAGETSLFDVIWSLEQPETTLIWLNVSDAGHEAVFRDIKKAPPGLLVIAIAGDDPVQRRQMNHRVADLNAPLPPGRSGCRYVDVDARFKSRDEWIRYLRNLPKSRPDDLWLRIKIAETCTTVREGDYAFVDPWHLFVRKVCEPGLPGQLSQLGIAWANPALTQATLIESTIAVASGEIEIRK